MRGVKLPDGTKRSSYRFSQRGQESVKGQHMPRVHHHFPSGEKRISIPVDGDGFGLRQVTAVLCGRHIQQENKSRCSRSNGVG